MTYRSFIGATGLFGLLKQRLHAANVEGSDLALVRLRVINIIKNWINHCPQDWEDPELRTLFDTLHASSAEDAVLLKHLEPLRLLLAKTRDAASPTMKAQASKINLPLYRVHNQVKSTRCSICLIFARATAPFIVPCTDHLLAP